MVVQIDASTLSCRTGRNASMRAESWTYSLWSTDTSFVFLSWIHLDKNTFSKSFGSWWKPAMEGKLEGNMLIHPAKTWLCHRSLSLSHGGIRDTVTLNWKEVCFKRVKIHRFKETWYWKDFSRSGWISNIKNPFFFSKFPKMILRWCCAMVFGLLFSAGAYFLELRQGTPLISLQGSEAWTPATAAMTSPPSPPSPASPASPVAMDADATDAVKMSWRYATRTELLEVMFASQFDSEVGNCSFEFKHACLGRPRVAKVPALKSGFLGATRISTKEGHSDQHALKPLDRLLRHVARRPPCIFTFVATRELIKLSFCSP